MLTPDALARIAREQEELVRSLTGKGEDPAGIDAHRLHATRQTLARKRAGAVAKLYPRLSQSLADDFPRLFETFAAETLLPQEGGALADGRAFARSLQKAKKCPEAARPELLQVDLYWRRSRQGLARRRGFFLRLARFHDPRRFVVALRLPWLGVFWIEWAR